jgi:threonine/homoserine/homoserine lactone efflux protein
MPISFFFKGLIIGFSIAAPVGPIGVLCIRRTLTGGRLSGFVSGLGAATADALYGCIAGFGLASLSTFLIHHQASIRLIGGSFLCYLGLKIFLSRPHDEAAQVKGNSLLGSYASTCFLTLTNPMTILSFAAIFAGLGLGSVNGNYQCAGVLVLGVFLGSSLWWLFLSSFVGLLRVKLNPTILRWVNRIAGAVIVAFGVGALLSLLK